MIMDPIAFLVAFIILMVMKQALTMRTRSHNKKFIALAKERYTLALEEWRTTQAIKDMEDVIALGHLIMSKYKDMGVESPLTTEQIYKDLYERMT